MAKPVKIKDLNPVGRKPYGVYDRFTEFFNLLLNSVKIVVKSTGKELNFEVETFVKKTLFEDGAVGFDKLTRKFYLVFGEEINDYGNPKTLNFRTANGRKTFTRKASYEDEELGAYMIKALPSSMSMAKLIKETTDFIANCDVAMRQNLEASKTPYVMVVKNKDLLLSYEQTLQQKQNGQAVVLVSEDIANDVKSIDISVDFLVDKFREARDAERDTLLTKLGILTANTDKKERVQSAEVYSGLGQATDYIYLLIDTFNKQMETYGLDFEMVFNGSMEQIYIDDGDQSPAPNEDEQDAVNELNKDGVERN